MPSCIRFLPSIPPLASHSSTPGRRKNKKKHEPLPPPTSLESNLRHILLTLDIMPGQLNFSLQRLGPFAQIVAWVALAIECPGR